MTMQCLPAITVTAVLDLGSLKQQRQSNVKAFRDLKSVEECLQFQLNIKVFRDLGGLQQRRQRGAKRSFTSLNV